MPVDKPHTFTAGPLAGKTVKARKPRPKREASLRGYFLSKMGEVGAIVYKQVPAGRKGKADEVVWAPHGQVVQVELKKLGEVPEPHQEREHARMRRRGHHVRVIDSKAGVDSLAAALRHSLLVPRFMEWNE